MNFTDLTVGPLHLSRHKYSPTNLWSHIVDSCRVSIAVAILWMRRGMDASSLATNIYVTMLSSMAHTPPSLMMSHDCHVYHGWSCGGSSMLGELIVSGYVAESVTTDCFRCYWFCYVSAHNQFTRYRQRSNEPLWHQYSSTHVTSSTVHPFPEHRHNSMQIYIHDVCQLPVCGKLLTNNFRLKFTIVRHALAQGFE